MANKQRGEVTLELVGDKYTLRPTFEALCELEDMLNIGILDIVAILHSGDVRLKFISAVTWAGIRGYSKDEAPSYEEVGEMVLKTGLTDVMSQSIEEDGQGALATFLLNGVTGDDGLPEKSGDEGNGEVETEMKPPKKDSAST